MNQMQPVTKNNNLYTLSLFAALKLCFFKKQEQECGIWPK